MENRKEIECFLYGCFKFEDTFFVSRYFLLYSVHPTNFKKIEIFKDTVTLVGVKLKKMYIKVHGRYVICNNSGFFLSTNVGMFLPIPNFKTDDNFND